MGGALINIRINNFDPVQITFPRFVCFLWQHLVWFLGLAQLIVVDILSGSERLDPHIARWLAGHLWRGLDHCDRLHQVKSATPDHRSPEMIKPTVGRIVWFTPGTGDDTRGDVKSPLAAMIAYVHSDTLINIGYVDQNGVAGAATSVTLLQEGDLKPENGCFCSWMPHPMGQAAKTGSLESKLSAVTADLMAKANTASLRELLGSSTEPQPPVKARFDIDTQPQPVLSTPPSAVFAAGEQFVAAMKLMQPSPALNAAIFHASQALARLKAHLELPQ